VIVDLYLLYLPEFRANQYIQFYIIISAIISPGNRLSFLVLAPKGGIPIVQIFPNLFATSKIFKIQH